LILDEPTNHLDIGAREALSVALNEFSGAVILITHDAHLAASVSDRLWLVKDGKVTPYEGDLDDYRAMIIETGKTVSARTKKSEISENVKNRRSAAAHRMALDPLKKVVSAASKRLDELNQILSRLDEALADPELYGSDVTRLTKLNKERAALVVAIEDAEEAWLVASEKYETALLEHDKDVN